MASEKPQNLDEKMQVKELAAIKNVDDIISQRIDGATGAGSDLGQNTPSQLRIAYTQKANELRTEIGRLKDNVDDETALKLQEAILISLSGRVDLACQIAGGLKVSDSVSSSKELLDLARKGTAIIQNADIPNLLHEHLLKSQPQLARVYERKLGRDFKETQKDSYELLKKLNLNEKLEDPDWAMLVAYANDLAMPSTTGGIDKTIALTLLDSLKPKDRLTLLDKMADQPKFGSFAKTGVVSGYLTRDQVELCLKPKIVELNKDPKKNAELLKVYTGILLELADPTLLDRQAKVDTVRAGLAERMASVHFGHTNTARQLLTFRGIGGTLLAANGALTIAANLMIGLGDPEGILENPAFLLGFGMLGGGLELNKGMADLLPQPSRVAAHLMADKDEELNNKTDLKKENLSRNFGNHPVEARFYYTFAEQIVKAYSDKTKLASSGNRPHLTVEELDLKWEQMPEEYRSIGKETLENQISYWAAEFALTLSMNSPGDRDGKSGQRAVMNDLFKNRGSRDSYTMDPELLKLINPSK